MNNSTSDDTAPSPKEPSSQHLPDLLLLNLQRIDAAVEGEYAENDRRLNWFLLFQAFLFQGYATALQAITGASDGHERQLAHAIVLMIIIIAVGLITSWVTHVSTQAGITATEKLKRVRERKYQQDAEDLHITTDGWFPKCDPLRLHDKGLRPTRWGPRIIFVAWVAVAVHCAWTFLNRAITEPMLTTIEETAKSLSSSSEKIATEVKALREDVEKLPNRLVETLARAGVTKPSYPGKPAFTIGEFSIFGPNATPEGLVREIFRVTVEKGPEKTRDLLNAAREGAGLAKDLLSVGSDTVDLLEKILKLFTGPDAKPTAFKRPTTIFDQVSFEHNQAKLNARALVALDNVAAYLKSDVAKADNILVEGHANALGNVRRNIALSEQRAQIVREYLVARGVESERIFSYGFGQGYPWLPFLPDHPDNRRVRITTCGEGGENSRCLVGR